MRTSLGSWVRVMSCYPLCERRLALDRNDPGPRAGRSNTMRAGLPAVTALGTWPFPRPLLEERRHARLGVVGAEDLGEQVVLDVEAAGEASSRGRRRSPAWPARARPRARGRARRPTRAPRSRTSAAGTTRSTRPMRNASSAPHLAAGEDQVLGARGPDQAGEPLGGAAAGDDAEQDLGLAERGVVRGHAQVARERELTPAAQRVAVDRGDDRTRDARPRASSASRK